MEGGSAQACFVVDDGHQNPVLLGVYIGVCTPSMDVWEVDPYFVGDAQQDRVHLRVVEGRGMMTIIIIVIIATRTVKQGRERGRSAAAICVRAICCSLLSLTRLT